MVGSVGEQEGLWLDVGELQWVFLGIVVYSGTGWVVQLLLLMLKLVFLVLQLRIWIFARG